MKEEEIEKEIRKAEEYILFLKSKLGIASGWYMCKNCESVQECLNKDKCLITGKKNKEKI